MRAPPVRRAHKGTRPRAFNFGAQTDSVLVEQLTALERGPLDEVKALRKCVARAG